MERYSINDHELRQEVNRCLDRPVNDGEWAYVERTGDLRRFREHGNPAAVAETIRQLRRAFGGAASQPEEAGFLPAGKRTYGGSRSPDRVLALSDFIAQQARKREDVEQFRDSVLRGQLVKPEDVEAWIARQGAADGPPTLFLSVPLPKSNSLVWTSDGSLLTRKRIDTTAGGSIISTSRIFLEFATPSGSFTQYQPVSITGVLNRLRMLSQKLASDYRWREAQATTFVLADLAPTLPIFSFSVHHGLLPVADRLLLDVDPSVSPRELAILYRKALRKTYSEGRERVTDKHLRLAAFAAHRPKGQTLAQGRKVWNRENPDLKYEYHTNFGRDLQDALRKVRLTKEDLETQRLRKIFRSHASSGRTSPGTEDGNVPARKRNAKKGEQER